MKKYLLLLLGMLGGCASQPGQLAVTAYSATLHPVWLAGDTLEVWLEDQRFTGAATTSACFTDACRGDFRNVSRYQRRLVRAGEADLRAGEGSALRCTWVSYRRQVSGECQATDGRRFKLQAA